MGRAANPSSKSRRRPQVFARLSQQSGEPGCRQHEADVLLGPSLLGEKYGDVGTEARQCSGEQQVDGIEAA
jgi:hypothetical protein